MIVGWRAATTMTTDLVLDTLEHAVWTRHRHGVTNLSGLVHHTDAGSQGGFNWPSQHLDLEVMQWVSVRSSCGLVHIEGRSLPLERQRWPGARIGSGSGRRSLAGSRPRRHVSRRACRARSASGGCDTLA